MADYSLNAVERKEKGTPASRRMRRTGWVPANVFGAGKDPHMVALNENELMQLMDDEGFFSSLISIEGLNERQDVLVREVQMHPYKPKALHVDFQRVQADQKLSLNVPLHVVNDEKAPGVLAGGTVSTLMNEVEVTCLPANIPDHIEVDVGSMEVGDTLHLSDLKAPSGVELNVDEESDQAVVNMAGVQGEPEAAVAEEVAEEAAGEGEEAGAGEEEE
ncbi:50S ribosomal protein L25/general stress protein Ctc [Thiohalorhabdus methylotrophus]|uniref:Large ribosomal subunit protein bL25 n=1 Tax=Thiohalorhabdus methylotrophus TaxID=3242694 RepID=A0ABV4TTF3_9GAMM